MTATVEDRLAIRELGEAIGAAIMRLDPVAWADSWADDGVWVLGPGVEIHGREAITERWKAAIAPLELCAFSALQGPLVVEGDAAHGVSFRQETLYLRNGDRRNLVARYDDAYAKRDGRWFLARRASQILRDEMKSAAE